VYFIAAINNCEIPFSYAWPHHDLPLKRKVKQNKHILPRSKLRVWFHKVVEVEYWNIQACYMLPF